jgi:hypothetical protein
VKRWSTSRLSTEIGTILAALVALVRLVTFLNLRTEIENVATALGMYRLRSG